MIDTKKTGQYIRNARISAGLSQSQLAERLCVSREAVSKWENGHHLPDVSVMEDLSDALGISIDELLSGNWKPEPALLRSLGETEHLRWCAFHYANGYAPMERADFESRAAAWKNSMEEGCETAPRPAKDTQRRLHACLIPWDELDELSAAEHRLTGRDVDYQQTDINNVLALPKLLAEERSGDAK